MERTTDKDGKVQFIKTGAGTLRFGRKIYKENQKFWAYPEEIPETFRDLIKPVTAEGKAKVAEAEEEIENIETKPSEYKLRHRGGPWYDVVDANGKQMNEGAKKRDEALKLIDSLE